MVWCSVIKVGYKHSWELVSRAGLQFPSSLAARHFFSPPQLHTGFSGTTCQSEGFLLASKGDGRQQTHLPDTKTSLQKCHVHFVCTAAISHRFHYSRIWRLFSWLIDTFLCSITVCALNCRSLLHQRFKIKRFLWQKEESQRYCLISQQTVSALCRTAECRSQKHVAKWPFKWISHDVVYIDQDQKLIRSILVFNLISDIYWSSIPNTHL